MYKGSVVQKNFAVAAAVVAALALGVAGQARAGCGDPRVAGTQPRLPLAALAQQENEPASAADSGSIVGLWDVSFVSKAVPGFNHLSLDVWHADGTEFESADLPPVVGAVCVGVWKQTGASTIQLNHFGWTWDTTGLTPTGYFNLIETVTLNATGSQYTGTFDFKPYDTSGNFEAGGEVTGTMSAKRIHVYSPNL